MGQYYVAVLSNAPSAEKFADGIMGQYDPHKYDNGAKLMEHSWVRNNLVGTVMGSIAATPARVVWAGDYADEEPTGSNLYFMVGDIHLPQVDVAADARYLLNLDLMEYIDLTTLEADVEGWTIHPLPLLTVEGNGRGGGDFRGSNPLVGAWARNLLTVAGTGWQPTPAWTQVFVNFEED